MVADLGPAARRPRTRPAPTPPGRRRARRPTTPPGRSSAAARCSERADRVQAVGAGEQREVRVVVARLGGHRLPGLERDVRRVADHHVDGARRGRRTRSARSPRRRSTPVPARLRSAQACAARVELDGVHGRRAAPRRRPPWRSRPSRCTRSTTTGASSPRACLDRPAGEQLGLGPRHEDAGPDRQLDVPEVGGAGEVLERLAGGPAGDQRVVRVAPPAAAPRRPAAAATRVGAEHVREQLGGVVVGTGDAGRAQPVGGLGQQRPAARHAQASSAVEPGGHVGLDAGVEHRLEVAVEHLVEVVATCSRCGGRRSGSPGSCRCGSARSGRPCGPGCGGPRSPRRRPPPGPRPAAGPAGCAAPAPCSAAGSSRSGS